jgi:hypothetical protein
MVIMSNSSIKLKPKSLLVLNNLIYFHAILKITIPVMADQGKEISLGSKTMEAGHIKADTSPAKMESSCSRTSGGLGARFWLCKVVEIRYG